MTSQLDQHQHWGPPPWRGRRRPGPPFFLLLLVVPLTLLAIMFAGLSGRVLTISAANLLLTFIVAVTMILARRFAVAVLIVSTALVLVLSYWLLSGAMLFPVLLPALAIAVARGHRAAGWITGAVAYISLTVLIPTVYDYLHPGITYLGVALFFLAVLVIGTAVAGRRRHFAELNRRRVSEERLLIARELHDVVAHNISLINVQSGVALHLMDDDPQQARTALAAIKTASRETLRELRSTLGVLRGVDEDAPRAPAPSLAQLGELTDRLAAAGLDVAVTSTGAPRELPANVDLAAYRIIQESLTNVHRHAGVPAAEVRIDYGVGRLTIEITDEGAGGVPVEGNGLVGMRERVASLDGSLTAAPRPDGRPGFAVHAVLPLNGDNS